METNRNEGGARMNLDALRTAVRGTIIEPDDPSYDAARAEVSGGFDLRPAAVVRVADAEDVSRVVRLAREGDVELAIRSGGHSVAGHSTTDGGILLDLAEVRALEIDAGAQTATAETGLRAIDVTTAAAEHGLAIGFGDTGSVGIGGITLGGGVGFLARKHGLTIDSLLEADVVTADGELRTVDAEREPDLFWAISGGGGNFGVATRFRYALAEVPSVVGGLLFLPATPETVEGFVSLLEAAPEELSGIANVMPAPPMPFVPEEHVGSLVIFGLLCFAGDAADAERALAPFRTLAEPLADMLKEMPYPEMFMPEDPDYRPLAVSRTLLTDGFDAEAARTSLERLAASDAPLRVVQIRALGGAIARVPNDATAFAHRDRRLMINVAAFYGTDAERTERERWVDDVSNAIQRGPVAAYVNFLGDEGDDRVLDAYPPATLERLRRIKTTYDPTNLFHRNQNIRPLEEATR
jgi:FAD/FMN-containing dehydrogenase